MKRIRLQKTLTALLGLSAILLSSAFSQTVSLDLSGMTPHIGQKLEARLISKRTMKEVDRTMINSIAMANFSLTLNGMMGESYWIDFYADFNGNGIYDAPPTDHAWRVDADALIGGMNNIPFTHTTMFDDIGWKHTLTLDLTNMTAHLDQKFEARMLDINNDLFEVSRISLDSIPTSDFSISFPGIETGHSYFIDFYADFNENGLYDFPPLDHAWRLKFDLLVGDTTFLFDMNTSSLTSIGWNYMLTFDIMGMNAHQGQLLELRVINIGDSTEIGRIKRMMDLTSISVEIPGLEMGMSYDVDLFTDFNGNGMYDAPPADHAWRETFTDMSGDTTISFTHNFGFTDIMWPSTTGILDLLSNSSLTVYPNPFLNTLNISSEESELNSVELFNSMGLRIPIINTKLSGQLIQIAGLNNLSRGIYILKISDSADQYSIRLLKR